jgi:hypothetical protein
MSDDLLDEIEKHWRLQAPPQTVTVVQRSAWDGAQPLARVYWDPETSWQFLGAHFSGDDEDAFAVCLKDAVMRWPHVAALAALEPGLEALWLFDQCGWELEKVDYADD